MHGCYPVGGILFAAEDRRVNHIPGPLADMGSVSVLWGGPGGWVTCGPMIDAAWH